MGKLIALLITFSCWIIEQQGVAQHHDPFVTTSLMRIKGRWQISYLGRPYKTFEGIPYAQPPNGELRFKSPRPITIPFPETIDGTREPNKCLQYDYETSRVVGNEDCLYLNIYVPSSRQNSLPVIIWLHEGAFQRGAGTYTRARYLMDRDAILLTLNYRLGPLGFLSTGDEVIAGNMGLKDQNLALRWVAGNIVHFGGDPRRISLFGASAGAASVHYHYLSKSSAGLFRNGVSFSGTTLSLWAYDPTPMKTAKLLAETLGCETESSSLLAKCLKSLGGEVLVEAVGEMPKRIGTNYYPPFAPVAERNASDYFIDRSPDEILRSGDVYDVPWISGVVSDEGARAMLSALSNNKTLEDLNDHWEALARIFFFNRTLPVDKHFRATRKIRRHYVGNGRVDDEDEGTIRGLVDMRSHRLFFVILEKAARLQARANESPVYTYLNSYRSAKSIVDYVGGKNAKFGPTHLDDVSLVLENEQIDPTTTERDRAILNVMLDFWYSIAATGEPKLSVDLPKVNPNSSLFEYLEIAGPNDYVLRSSDNFGDKKFWSSLGFDLDV